MEKAKPQFTIPCSPFFFISFFIISFQCSEIRAQIANTTAVPVGVILDLTSETGIGCQTSIQMAYDDFYAANPNYTTRVNFTFYNSGGDPNNATDIASNLTGYSLNCGSVYRTNALNANRPTAGGSIGTNVLNPVCIPKLVERNVEAILMGLQTSTDAYEVRSICNQTQVPLISFSTATSPDISAENFSILIRASLDYSSEYLPIANLTKHFNWDSVVLVFEDDDTSIYQFAPNTDPPVVDHIAIPSNTTDSDIEDALQQMMDSKHRAFLVDVASPQAIRIFQLADELGMMSKGYVWVVTSSVGDILDTLQPAILSSMNGVIGLTTNHFEKEKVMNFSESYKAKLQKECNITVKNPTTYQLWAYDAAWAVAMAAETTKISDPTFAVPPLNRSLEKLTTAILNTNFREGLAGNFSLVDGQRKFSTYEIVNVVDNFTRCIGFWSQQSGITESKNSTVWPGNLAKPPKSETYKPTVLKIGIPVNRTSNGTLGNFSVSVFTAAADLLPKQCNYTFVNLTSTSNRYEDLMRDYQGLQLDGIVGDIIIPEGEAQANFTNPYMEGGVQMVVRIQQDTSGMGMWMFLRPFTLNLWLAIIAFILFTGLAIWVTEHRVNPNYGAEDSSRVEKSFRKQLGNALYSAFSTAFYSHDGSLKKTLSRFLLIVWLFVVFVLTASYNASLSAILTVEKLKPALNSLDDLKQSGGFVGCQEGSIVCDLLRNTFSFSKSQIRSLQTDEYADALNNGRVSAIFDVERYLKVFLNQQQNSCNFTIVGPTYQSKGFGFAFDDSDLLNDLSRAIFRSEIIDLKDNFFAGSGCGNGSTGNESHTLSFKSFGGLFISTGVVSGLTVIISLVWYVHKKKNDLKDTLRKNKTVRGRISALWKDFLTSESSKAKTICDCNCRCTNRVPRTDPPEGVSPVEMQEINKGR